MRELRLSSPSPRLLLLLPSLFAHLVLFAGEARAAAVAVAARDNNPLNIDWDPAPPPEEGPPLSAGALRDPAYLPAQIGGIVGSYALSLVLVAAILLVLSKKRREALSAGDEEFSEVKEPQFDPFPSEHPLSSPRSQRSHVRNFSYPSPDRATFPTYVYPSTNSVLSAPGIDSSVDQRVVAADRDMAQQQLEDIYKYVMEQDEAKANGITLDGPPPSLAGQTPHGSPQSQHQQRWGSTSDKSSVISKKERSKPAALNLGNMGEKEKSHSRASSILSALRSPRKKSLKGISISSPIMTPMSGTFPPTAENREMNTIPPRQYAPAAPPPVPTNQPPFGAYRSADRVSPLTPEYSPESTASIDERIGPLTGQGGHSRQTSHAPTVDDPMSAATDSSQAPLVGLPASPKPHMTRFPSLPSSPKPGVTFSRAAPPTAVRTGGSLPLRAYEPALTSPSAVTTQTKQTVFERMGPLSPSGQRTPYTGAAVPYSPYQPFSPVIPITPSLVTKADRKRMKKLEPKTPTLQMVKASDDIW